MKRSKIILATALTSCLVSANTNISVTGGKKDYQNSKTKIDGTTYNFAAKQAYKDAKVLINYTKDTVDRENKITKKALQSLEVEKYNINYNQAVSDKVNLKASFIKIIDNLAPTDQGKIYGVGSTYNINKGLGISLDIYKSDYKQFDVNQYDLSVFKGFKIGNTKLKATVLAKSIQIDGDKYANYTFKDKDYFTTGVKLGANHNGFVAGVGAFFGKRMFTVMDDGNKVQHHAMEQDKTYMLSVGKKFKNFDIIAKYSFQNGKELPEKQDNVDTKVTSLLLNYKF